MLCLPHELATGCAVDDGPCRRLHYGGPRHQHVEPHHDRRYGYVGLVGQRAGFAALFAVAAASHGGRVGRQQPHRRALSFALDRVGRSDGVVWRLCHGSRGLCHASGSPPRRGVGAGRVSGVGAGREYRVGLLSLAGERVERARAPLAQPHRQRHVDRHDPQYDCHRAGPGADAGSLHPRGADHGLWLGLGCGEPARVGRRVGAGTGGVARQCPPSGQQRGVGLSSLGA